jgi:chromosome segregation ATPase
VSEQDLVRLLPKLLKEHPELRYEVVGILAESFATKSDTAILLEELKKLREDFNRKADEDSRRFEAVDKRFEAIDRRFEAVDKRFEAIDRRFEAVDKRFEAIESELKLLRLDFNVLAGQFVEFKKQMGGLQETVGAFVESYYTSRVVGELEKRFGHSKLVVRRNIEVQGREVDAVVSNSEIYVLEISGVVRREDVEKVAKVSKALASTKEYAGKTVKAVVAGVRFDSHAVEAAAHLGVEVIYV